MKITILGAGAWGTALAVVLAQRHPVLLWGRDEAHMLAAKQARENKAALPGLNFPEQLTVSSSLEEALNHVQGEESVLFVATSVAGLRQVAG
ncbi:MAG: glycerol-3-phosphate dehydrogenase, partial [Burkholderiaceae bacterium]|nr:glycerol-3-phosphate dehydrogenase [Burkholderiaceae bacterium]